MQPCIPNCESQPPVSSEPTAITSAPLLGNTPSSSPHDFIESHGALGSQNVNSKSPSINSNLNAIAPYAQSSTQLASSSSQMCSIHNEITSSRTHSMTTQSMNNIFKPKQMHIVSKHPLPPSLEPTCVSQAVSHPQWRDAMSSELTALMRHGTLDLAPPPKNCNPVAYNWVFWVKRKADG